MVEKLSDLFPLILAACVAALVASPMSLAIGARLGLMDVPGSAPHKTHPSATPLVGGPVLAISVAVAYLLLAPPVDGLISGMLVAGALALVWGLIDDRLGMPPAVKAIGQLLIAALLIKYGVQVRITQIPAVDISLTLLWVVGMMNAFNFVDSMDGLAVGLGIIAAVFFMLVTLDAGQPALAELSATILGASIGLYFFNASPARLFLGDSGAQMLELLMSRPAPDCRRACRGLCRYWSWVCQSSTRRWLLYRGCAAARRYTRPSTTTPIIAWLCSEFTRPDRYWPCKWLRSCLDWWRLLPSTLRCCRLTLFLACA